MTDGTYLHPSEQYYLPVLSAGLDWITSTTEDRKRVQAVSSYVGTQLNAIRLSGIAPSPYAANGYVGLYTPGITLAERGDSLMARLSGDAARIHGPSLLSLVEKVSRLDVQVTIADSEESRNWASLARHVMSADKRVESGMTRTVYLSDGRGGDTFYLGRRVSTRFYRVYNKTAQSKGEWPDGSWRFEIEYKGARAEHWADHIRAQKCTVDVARAIVAAGFRDYGFEIPCLCLTSAHKDKTPRHQTTDEQRLEYLGKSIRPMILRMKEIYGSRILADVIGLDDVGREPMTEGSVWDAQCLTSDKPSVAQLSKLQRLLRPLSPDSPATQ